MLSWQLVHHLCDVASLGSATNRASLPELASLASYPQILAIYDLDSAGDRARQFFSHFKRLTLITPPAHDLTDYFRPDYDLTFWLTDHIII